jgi:hypothetical protein
LLFMLSTLAQLSRAQSATAPVPEANPGRPTVSTPATLTPVDTYSLRMACFSRNTRPSFRSALASAKSQNCPYFGG